MTANTSPIFTITPKVSWAKITAADTGYDGSGANVAIVCTGGTNGSFLNRLIFQAHTTSGTTNTSSAVARIYLNNGSSIGTGTNNVLIREVALPAVSVRTAPTYAQVAYSVEVPFNLQLPSGYTIAVGISVMAANTSWDVSSWSGDY